jgi:hypothetical protein
MFNITSGRGGWFHNFGGLSTPVNIWTNAYYKPKTLSTGLDIMVMNSSSNKDATEFNCNLKYYGNNEKYSVIVVMTDKKDNYNVTVNGEDAEVFIRDKGIVEITISGEVKTAEIKVF